MEIVDSVSTKVTTGTVDFHGEIADRRFTGGRRASSFIIWNEAAERMAFFSIAVNMVSYLVTQMHQSLPDAATHVSDWVGASYFLTLLGAFLADSFLGRFKTIVVFSCVYALGMVLLTLSATVDNLHPPACVDWICPPPTTVQNGVIYLALALIALGTGGIKPCVSSFGADQYDERDEKEAQDKYSFFNWFFFAINMGVLVGITLVVYIQAVKGWGWGFGTPTAVVILSILVLVAGSRLYRYQRPTGSPFTRFAQVLVAALINNCRGGRRKNCSAVDLYELMESEKSDIPGARKLEHTKQYSFLDMAAMMTPTRTTTATPRPSRWRLCTVTQVEEFKCFIRVLPVWATTIALSIPFAQLSTFFVSQAKIMDKNLGPDFTIPTGSVTVFGALNGLIVIPLYEMVLVPFTRRFTGHPRGMTSLQRIGVGLFISIFALIAAAIIEKKRRESENPSDVTVFWLVPQFFLVGSAEVFAYVGQLEFFYDEATDGTRSLSSAMFLSEIGIGSWLNTALVKIVVRWSGGEENGWLRNDLNRSRLDYFYWVIAGDRKSVV